MAAERLLTVRDLIERTQLSRSTIMALLARNEIESLTIHRARRVRESALAAFIEARAAAAAERPTAVSTAVTPATDPQGIAGPVP